MLITLKTLQQKVFKVEVELSESVSELKEKVAKVGKEDHGGEYPTDKQKLIFQGKILDDAKKLEEYQITEKGFIVLMITKPKVQPKPAEPKPEPVATPAQETTTPSAATTPASDGPPSTEANQATPPPSTPAPAQPVPNPMVDSLCAMGFPRAEAEAALRAAFNNPDRAVEYLTNGIPPELQAAAAAPTPAAQPTATNAPSSGNTTPAAPRASANTLERIQNEPQFQQIRSIIRENPHLLEQFVAQLRRENPELFELITANQEDFVNLINAPDDGAAAPAGTQGTDGNPNVRQHDGRLTLEVTEAERQAIDRLKQLGFPEELVVQAYFACEKNEELAANFLLQQMDFQ